MIDRKAQSRGSTAQQSEPKAKATGAATMAVISLGDLTTGPEAEINRLKAQLAGLTAELGKLRGENQKLLVEKQSLNAELLEMRRLLSSVQVKELQGQERGNSWLRSLKMVL